jgi:Ca-activated chloride channel family protein
MKKIRERGFGPRRNTGGKMVVRMMAPLLFAVGCGICLCQEPIRVQSTLVQVAFTARDTHGQLVGNLTENDVDVFEAAVPQKIAYFARSVDVPLTLGLVLDDSTSQKNEIKKHEQDLEVFLKDVLGPKDRAFLVCFGDRIRLVSNFSQSGNDLMARLRQYRGKAPKEKSDRGKPAPAVTELGPLEAREGGTAFFDAIFFSALDKLQKESGRRALLVFSDGEDNASSHDMMTTIEEAQRADVLVFTIRYTDSGPGNLNSRNEFGRRVMERIAKETGGEEFDAKKTDPHVYFKRIGEELRTSYELGYYPADTNKDDTFRTIAIRPKNEEIRLRLKTGYYAR